MRGRYKYRFLVILFLSALAPGTLSAQKSRENTISVSGLSLKEIRKALGEKDFFIANCDEDNQTCFTAPRAMPDSTNWPTANIAFFVHVKDDVAMLSAKVDPEGSGTNMAVDFRGIKKGLNMQAFLFLDSFARSFGRPVTYSRR